MKAGGSFKVLCDARRTDALTGSALGQARRKPADP